ncbi:MAG: hypothetical protein HY321_01080 [Armatimonadetes bacterium]|nr:hypothetical protein [Armatimonadota bacterium]
MRRWGEVIGGLMLAQGAALAVAPRKACLFWDREFMPQWIRGRAEPWVRLPDATLRGLGAGMAAVSGLLLRTARQCAR